MTREEFDLNKTVSDITKAGEDLCKSMQSQLESGVLTMNDMEILFFDSLLKGGTLTRCRVEKVLNRSFSEDEWAVISAEKEKVTKKEDQ